MATKLITKVLPRVLQNIMLRNVVINSFNENYVKYYVRLVTYFCILRKHLKLYMRFHIFSNISNNM